MLRKAARRAYRHALAFYRVVKTIRKTLPRGLGPIGDQLGRASQPVVQVCNRTQSTRHDRLPAECMVLLPWRSIPELSVVSAGSHFGPSSIRISSTFRAARARSIGVLPSWPAMSVRAPASSRILTTAA